jgi:hypothetical protein
MEGESMLQTPGDWMADTCEVICKINNILKKFLISKDGFIDYGAPSILTLRKSVKCNINKYMSP